MTGSATAKDYKLLKYVPEIRLVLLNVKYLINMPVFALAELKVLIDFHLNECSLFI